MGTKLTVTGLDKFRARLQAKARAAQREAAGALGEAATVLEKEARARVFPARKVNQQDAPGNRVVLLAGRSPVRTTLQTSQRTAIVRVSRHWTTARSAAVRNTFTALGLADKLQRRGLVVRARGFVLFSRDAKLATWAHRADKGNQYLRHVVRLSDPRAIQRLSLTPAVRESIPRISAIWLRATRRAIQA